MPQFVKTDMRQIIFLEDFQKMVRHIVWLKWCAIRPFENVIAFLIGTAELAAIFFLLRFGGKEDTAGFGGQREAAATALRLGFVLLDACHHLTDGVPNQQAVEANESISISIC